MNPISSLQVSWSGNRTHNNYYYYGHLQRFNDENSSEEGDEKGGEPLVGLVVAEHDAVRPQEKDGHKDDRDAKGPADEDAKPR